MRRRRKRMNLEEIDLRLVETTDDVVEMMQWVGNQREFLGWDIETTGLNVGNDRIRLCQFGDHTHAWAMDWRDWRGVAVEIFKRYDRPIVAHNALFDTKFFAKDGISIPNHLMHDTMIMSFLKDSSTSNALKPSAVKYVDRRANAGKGLLEASMAQGGWDWDTVPVTLPAYWMYSAMDTALTSLLASKLYAETAGGAFKEAYELELAVIHCLRKAELAGLHTDPEYLEQAAQKLCIEIEELKLQIPLSNPGSDKQVIELLQGMGAVLTVRTEKGNLSVDKHVLRYLAKQGFSVASLIEQYRSKTRLLTSYIEKFMEVPDGLAVGRALRASTHPVGARTGRMSVTEPPLQTLPRGRVVRDAIVARPGYRIVMADFAGMEMRAMASLSKEQNMLDAFSRGEDLHNFVARSVYGEGFTKVQRGTAKNSGFAKIFGAGIEQFAVTAGISVGDAQAFLARYDQMFPRVDQFMQEVIQVVSDRAGGRKGKGWIRAADGRHLVVDGDKPYVGVNYLIQGGTAVATKRKIVELDAVGLGDSFRLAVHDELLFEVPEEHSEEARHIIERVMPDRTTFPNVVLEVESDVVERWGQHYRGDEYPKYVHTEDPEWLT
jgi:DNA polymerase-1